MPRELQRRVLVALSAGFAFGGEGPDMSTFLRVAREAYELGRHYATPELYLLGPPKTGTTWLYECMAGTRYEWWGG